MTTKSSAIAATLLSLSLAASAMADGRIEEARKAFYDVAQRSYADTVKYLDASDQKDAAIAASQLKENLNKLENPLLYVEKDIATIDPALKSRWDSVMKLFGNLRTSTGLLEARIGNASTASELSTLKEYFQKFGDELNKAYEEFKKYGKELDDKFRRFQTLCDTCR